jgi:hypothetical protein
LSAKRRKEYWQSAEKPAVAEQKMRISICHAIALPTNQGCAEIVN